MKLQRSTLILVAIALVLGTGVLVLESRRPATTPEKTQTPQAIFQFREAQVQSFQVKTPTQTLVFRKSGKTPAPASPASPSPTPAPTPQWQMQSPQSVPGNDATIAYLLSLIASGQSTETFTVPANRAGEFGLDQPTATIEVTLENQQKHRLILGKPNFNGSALYAQADPPQPAPPTITVLSISTAFTDAVNRPLSDWQQSKTEDSQPASPSSPAPASSSSPTPSPAPPN